MRVMMVRGGALGRKKTALRKRSGRAFAETPQIIAPGNGLAGPPHLLVRIREAALLRECLFVNWQQIRADFLLGHRPDFIL